MDRIGEHRIVEKLDGYGREVYLSQRRDGTRALIALFDFDDVTAENLEETAARCLALNAPHLSYVVELFNHANQRAVVFEDVRGVSLSKINRALKKHDTRLTDGALLEICKSVCRALEAAHMAKGEGGRVVPLVHHQLGPHQIFVSFEGEVRVLGMGLGPIFELHGHPDELPALARAYAAPEVVQGNMVTARSNTFSVAAMLWAGLTGDEPPDDGRFPRIARLLPELPKELARTIDNALEPVALRRSVTCRQLASALVESGIPSREELLANIDVLSRDSEIGGAAYPLESLPPTSDPDEADSEGTTNVYEVKTPRVAVPDPIGEEDDDETATLDTGEDDVVSAEPETPKQESKQEPASKGEPKRAPLDSVTAASPGVVVPAKSPPPSPELPFVESSRHVRTQIPAPPRAPALTRRGVGSGPAPSGPDVVDEVAQQEPVRPASRPPDANDPDVERLKRSREKLARRETMPLATSLRAQLKKPPGLEKKQSVTKIRAVKTTTEPAPHADDSAETAVLPSESRPPAKTQEIPDDALLPRNKPKLPVKTQEIPNEVAQEVIAGDTSGLPRNKLKISAITQEIPQDALDALAAEERRRLHIETKEIHPPPEGGKDPSLMIPPQAPVDAVGSASPIVDEDSFDAHVPPVPVSAPAERPSPQPFLIENPPSVQTSPRLRVLGEDRAEQIVYVASREPGVNWWNVFALIAFVGSLGLAGGLALGRFSAEPTVPKATDRPSAPQPPAPVPRTPSSAAAPDPPAPRIEPTETTTVLLIDTTQKDAHVYLGGKPIGPVSERVAAPCGVHNIRLGTFPLTKWVSQQGSFDLPCGKTLEITLEPFYAGPRKKP